MAEEQKRFPASDLKLDRLRKSGVVPLSEDVMTFAVVLGVFIGLYVMFLTQTQSLLGFFDSLNQAPSQTDSLSLNTHAAQAFKEASGKFVAALSAVICPLVAVVILVGALQTRFLFSLGSLKLDFGRLFRFDGSMIRALGSRGFAGMVYAVRVFAWLVVSALLLRYVFLELIPSSGLEHEAAQSELLSLGSREIANSAVASKLDDAKQQMSYFWFCALGFCFFVGLLSRFLVVLSFHRAQRMTRSEVETEMREMEQTPELKAARGELNAQSFEE